MVAMLEPGTTPTCLGLTGPEWHAAGYGLMEGLKFWKRKPVAYDEIDSLRLSPEWKADLKAKYHYYWTAFDLPEDIALLVLIGWFGVTHFDSAMHLLVKAFGGILIA